MWPKIQCQVHLVTRTANMGTLITCVEVQSKVSYQFRMTSCKQAKVLTTPQAFSLTGKRLTLTPSCFALILQFALTRKPKKSHRGRPR